MELIFGSEKELTKEYKFLINDVLPSLNDCNFCNKQKCKYCKNYSVNFNMCKKDTCFNCWRFNKSKDILINSNNKIISNYVKTFLYDFFLFLIFQFLFFNLNINVNNSQKITDIEICNRSIKSNDVLKKEKKFFYYKSKKFRHYCKKKVVVKKNCFF